MTKLNLQTAPKAIGTRALELSAIADANRILMDNEQHEAKIKALHDKVHNAEARQVRLAMFMDAGKDAQRYVFKNAKNHDSAVLSTSSIYAFDTLIKFTKAITDGEVPTRQCFYTFFEAFAENNTVNVKDIQNKMVRECISKTTKLPFTIGSAKTWTRNCFHAMEQLGGMIQEKCGRDTYYTLNPDSKVVADLLKTPLLNEIAIELDMSDFDRI